MADTLQTNVFILDNTATEAENRTSHKQLTMPKISMSIDLGVKGLMSCGTAIK
jgi:hypothetical protein